MRAHVWIFPTPRHVRVACHHSTKWGFQLPRLLATVRVQCVALAVPSLSPNKENNQCCGQCTNQKTQGRSSQKEGEIQIDVALMYSKPSLYAQQLFIPFPKDAGTNISVCWCAESCLRRHHSHYSNSSSAFFTHTLACIHYSHTPHSQSQEFPGFSVLFFRDQETLDWLASRPEKQ